jgi:hypothetical protein
MLASLLIFTATILLVALAVWFGLVVSFVTLSRIAAHADVKDARALEASGRGAGS